MRQRVAKRASVETKSNLEALEALAGLFVAARQIASSLDVSDEVSSNELFDAIALAQLTLLRLEANELSK